MNDTVSLSLEGTFYDVSAPDTLDLADRARLAINGLGGKVDIAPRDGAPSSYSLYQRSHLQTSATPFRRVRRFVAARTVLGW
jgi:hypothetical protein